MCGSLFAFTYIQIYNTIFTERSTIITKKELIGLIFFGCVVKTEIKLFGLKSDLFYCML